MRDFAAAALVVQQPRTSPSSDRLKRSGTLIGQQENVMLAPNTHADVYVKEGADTRSGNSALVAKVVFAGLIIIGYAAAAAALAYPVVMYIWF
jgi:hypothetical protein